MTKVFQSIEKLIDQEARDRFAQELDTNFSVIAPAGVGKTTAIVQRIVSIAQSCDYRALPGKLSKLVVVTYTQKAADEMRNRSYQALLKTNALGPCLQEFNKAFFGTIHSFCLKIIQSYGSQLGIPSNAALLINDENLWHDFLNANDDFQELLPGPIKDELCKHINLSKLIQLARNMRLDALPEIKLSECPPVDLSAVLNYTSTRSAKKVLEIQKDLQRWLLEYQTASHALEIPEITQGDSEFKQFCADAFAPLWHWLGDAAHVFALGLAKQYQQFRISKGFISYDDIVDLAAKLVANPHISQAIHELDYHVILDEAQDTDANQFAVLLGIVQDLPGRFSMLGDPQQAIYSSRADLPTYLKVHKDFLHSHDAETLTFNVTMRCDRSIVAHCNTVFPSILKDKATFSQINFVPLSPRPWAEEGYVSKLVLEKFDDNLNLNTNNLEQYEAQLLAAKINHLGLKGLGISDWSELAILAPRKSWLAPVAKALQALEIPVQIHSRNDIKGDNPAFAWLTALLIIMVKPNDSFESTGVLREIFGLSDDAIANYTQWWDHDKSLPHPLNIACVDNLQEHPVAQALTFLNELRNEFLKRSLSEAIHYLIDNIELRSRLAALPGYDVADLFDCLDAILIQAMLAEEQGSSIHDFAFNLQNDYQSSADPVEELKGHVQFLTSHKAKGLEWPVVIVPFLFRSILFPPQEYPQLISVGSAHAPKIAVCNHPDKATYDTLLEQYRIAELERLLYVTATRARNHLIWVDDEALFKNAKISFASLLNIIPGNPNRPCWTKLMFTAPLDCLHSESAQESTSQITRNHSERFDPTLIATARSHAKVRLQRIIPSQLKQNFQSYDPIERSVQGYSPLEYGNWWHKMMQTLPWNTQAEWNAHYLKYLLECPDPVRGKCEFELFINSLLLNSLLNKYVCIKTEVPFLFKDENNITYEGFIDFFAYNELTKKTIIIDWKTDLLDSTPGGLSLLTQTYSKQLAVYQQAVVKSFNIKPRTFLFITCLGELAECGL